MQFFCRIINIIPDICLAKNVFNIILYTSGIIMDKEYTIYGFRFKVKNTLITVAVACAILIVLLLIDRYLTPISWYGVIIGSAFMVALVLATQTVTERGLPSDYPYDLIWWVFPICIVFARAYYVLNALDEFHSFYDVIAIWNGGIAIYGGIIGGILAIFICSKIKKHNFVDTLDCIAPVLILAQSIGRWGNYVNQEVFGREITNASWQWFPFAVHINNGTFNGWYMATFFYESVINLVGFFVLMTLLRKVKLRGIVCCGYLIFEGIIRYFLEGLRVPEYILYIPGTKMPVSQAVSLGMIFIGTIWLLIITIKRNKDNAKNNQTLSH